MTARRKVIMLILSADSKLTSRHIACDDKQDCNTSNNIPTNMTMKATQAPQKVRQELQVGK